MQNEPPRSEIREQYWTLVQRLTLRCLAVWFAVTFLVIYFARELSAYTVFGWPVSFYMAAQGLTLIYVLIVAWYAVAMRAYDKMLKGR
jgi:putative solute:sodium symporter small subunit